MKTKLLILSILIIVFMLLPFAVGCNGNGGYCEEENGCKLPERDWVEAQEGLIFFRFLPRLVSGNGDIIGLWDRYGMHSSYYVITSQEQLDAIQIRLNVDGGHVYVPLRSTAILSDWLLQPWEEIQPYQSEFFARNVLILFAVNYGSQSCEWSLEFRGAFVENHLLYFAFHVASSSEIISTRRGLFSAEMPRNIWEQHAFGGIRSY